MKRLAKHFSKNKRGFSADAVPLSSALRPRLFKLAKVGLLPVFLVISLLYIVNFHTNNVSATSITLTIPGSLSLDVNPNTNSGYAKSSNGNISVTADSPFGYTLSIKSKDSTNGNALMNGSNKLVSITESTTEDTYKSTGTVNTWSYIPSKVNGTANTNVRPGPSTTGETIEKTSVANASTANNYTVALVTKVDKTLQSGSYKNTFIISAVANSVNYSITYNLESGSWTGTSPQTGSTPENKVKLSSVTPTRANYTFEGWCTASTSNETCSGTKYSPGADYSLTNSTNTITLYAMWKQQIPAMQDFKCSSLGSGQSTTLKDSRDGNKYTVAKLLDGKCWMAENLKLQGSRTLTSSDSNVSSSWTLPASGTIPGSFTDPQMHYDFTYGGYYNWIAATAGTNPSSGNASSSICPKGWHLPTGGNKSGDFSSLTKAYGGSGSNQTSTTVRDALMATPAPGFVYSGHYYSRSLYDTDSRGIWWSSTAGSSNFAYRLDLDSSGSVYPLGYSYNSKNIGYSVRCVAG